MRSPLKGLVTTALLVALAAAAWMMWPASLGGRTTYVITHGVSMEPGFHTGDLAILRAASSYRVGDVAAYRSDTLHSVVMHRIHALDATGAFVFKGDNNSWLDPDHPTAAKVVGRLALRVPAGGRYLHLTHTPWALTLLGALMIGTGSTKAHRRRRRHAQRSNARPVAPAPLTWMNPTTAMTAVAVAVAVTLTAGYLWSRPATVAGTRAVTVTHAPAMTYDAAARQGATYPDGHVHTGQPVYLRLVQQVTVRLTDPITATARLGAVTTTAVMTATLSTPTGWTATLDATPTTDLSRGPATLTLDLPGMLRKLEAVAAETGVPLAGGNLTLSAHLASRADVDGHPIDSTAETSYGFTFDATALRPSAASPTATTPSTPTGLTTTAKLPTRAAATVGVRGHSLPLSPLRLLLSLFAAACCLIAAGLVFGLRSTQGRSAETRRTFGNRLLEVTSLDPNDRVVTVASPAALLKIATRYERLVLHLPGEYGGVYAVHDDGISYRWTDTPAVPTVRHLWSAA